MQWTQTTAHLTSQVDFDSTFGLESRFYFYSKRVQTFRIFWQTKRLALEISYKIWDAWSRVTHLFPKLNGLILPAYMLYKYSSYCVPFLRFLNRQPLIRFGLDMGDGRHSLEMSDIEDALTHIKKAMTSVKHLSLASTDTRSEFRTMSWFASDDDDDYEPAPDLTLASELACIIALASNMLSQFSCAIPVELKALNHIVGPAGTHLRILDIGYSAATEEESLDLDPVQIPHNAFRNLQLLRIWGSWAFMLSKAFLRIHPNGCLEELTLNIPISDFDDTSFKSALAALSELIPAHDTIRTLRIELETTTAGNALDSIMLSGDWIQFHKAFRALSRLQFLRLAVPEMIHLRPADVCGLTHACPHLRSWKITVGTDKRKSLGFVSASWSDFLQVLRACPRLREVPLNTVFAHETMDEPLSEAFVHDRYGPKLQVGGKGDATEIAKLLMRVIPSVRECEDVTGDKRTSAFARKIGYGMDL
jgi:hypothetical protein